MRLSGEGNRISAAPLRSSLDCWHALSCLPTLLISSSDAAQYFNGYASKEMNRVFGIMAGCKSSSTTGTKITGTLSRQSWQSIFKFSSSTPIPSHSKIFYWKTMQAHILLKNFFRGAASSGFKQVFFKHLPTCIEVLQTDWPEVFQKHLCQFSNTSFHTFARLGVALQERPNVRGNFLLSGFVGNRHVSPIPLGHWDTTSHTISFDFSVQVLSHLPGCVNVFLRNQIISISAKISSMKCQLCQLLSNSWIS